MGSQLQDGHSFPAQNSYPRDLPTMGHGKNGLGSRWRREKVTSILATKLYLPWLRPNVVIRPRLLERLHEGLDRKLTRIAATAGLGDTTMVRAWDAGNSRKYVWPTLADD